MNWLYWLTGGRPMKHVEFLFTDVVSGRGVHSFIDCYGRRWMAEGPWSWFRVRHYPKVHLRLVA
jgi:hypothetical protein